MKSTSQFLFIALALLGLLVLTEAEGPGGLFPAAHANPGILYVAPGGNCSGGATPVATCYASVQKAVDQAGPGDEVRVAAGLYTGVQARAGLTQAVYISRTVTVRGGYTTTNWLTADPVANPTTLDAGGLGRGLVITGPITVTLEGLRITGGDATGLGGGLLGSDVGGGVYVYTATAAIGHCVIYSNTASTANLGSGGGLYLDGGVATLSSNTVVSNTGSTAGQGSGGGLDLENSDNAALNGNTVRGNTGSTTSSGWGGGLVLRYSDNATLSGNTVQGNTATTGGQGSGGGLYLENSPHATLSGNTILSNTASTATSNWGWGGGLYLHSNDATLSGNTVQGNTASTGGSGSGGGLYFISSSGGTLSGNTVVSNTASTGNVGWGGGLYLVYGDATLSSNTVQGNTGSMAASGGGGGLYLDRSDATLSGNVVQGNTASTGGSGYGYGGGVYLYRSEAALSGNTVVSNTASTSGGGVYVWYSHPLTLTNNLVADNQADTAGSGLWLDGSSTYPTSGRLLHTTIANNHSSGQGVYVGEYTTLAFTNTILAGHDSVGIFVNGSTSTATLEATLWYGNGALTGGGGTIVTGTVNVYGDPAFANPSAWDYHLTAGSAARDAGVDAGVTTDVDGDPRPMGAGYDIGVDEYVAAHIYLPTVLKDYTP